MFGRELLLSSVVALAAAAPVAELEARADASAACQSIASKISANSKVVYPLSLSLDFQNDIHHWFDSSTQTPACVLEAGSPNDVATAVGIIGSSKVPFAIRSGGHASNPGFSSTTGVHINYNNIKQVQLSPDKSSVEIGYGNTWLDVYQRLEGTGVNVVGGRTPGPGVGGFTLGGGFSWKTNQFGLTADTVKAYNLVLPNGTATRVDSSNKDLFFALKGGLNRFGVVTSAEYYTHPQPSLIYGGFAIYSTDNLQALLNATTNFFKNNKDDRAQVITTVAGGASGSTGLSLYFFDGPTEPDSFKPFDSIPSVINTVKSQSFSSFVGGIPSLLQTNARGTFNTLSTTALTPAFVAAVRNQSEYYGSQMAAHGGSLVSYDVEPFATTHGQHATDSAYPHADSPLPLNLYFSWLDASQDAYWYQAMRDGAAALTAVAKKEGIYRDDFTTYPNYAIAGTSAEALYGATNAQRLRAIKKSVDPNNIMGLAGGFDLS